MKQNWHLLISLSVVLVTSGQGALQFTNVSSAGFSSTLNAVAWDNQSNFVAVGQSTLGLSASFNLTAWASTPVVTNALGDGSLFGLTYGAGRFVAGGVNASTFFSSDRTNWVRGSKANSLQVTIPALTYNPNDGRFASVGLFPLASWSTDVATSWTAGALTAPVSPFFSFHGLAAFGTSSFVTCGDSGTIRISTDGGVNWAEKNPNVGSDFSLRAVASDGNQQLVAVGNSGRVIYSLDGGGSWQTNLWISTGFSGLNLNAVAFLNPGFIVVGDNGRVFTISDITTTNWTVNTPTANNLLGVASGTGGSVEGLSVMVGAGGTIIVAGTPPLAPINPVNQTVCAGSANPPLSVSVVATDTLHPAFAIAVDWYDASGTILVATNTTTFVPSFVVSGGPNAAMDNTYFARTRDLRTGFVSTNRIPVVLTVNPRPSLTLDPLAVTNCNYGLTSTLTGAVQGIGPWTLTWNDGTPQTVTNIGAGPVNFTRQVVATNPLPNQAITALYFVTNLVDANCIAIPSIDLNGTNSITVFPTPTVDVVANQGPYCNTNGGLAINFSGPVLGTTFSWTSTVDVGFGTSGAGNIGAFTAINGGTVPVMAIVTVTPTANGCVGTQRAFAVTVNPTPTVDVVANQGPYCNTNGGSAISFSGPVAGTTFSWSSTVNVGFGLSGNGNIGAFIAINGGTVPVVATVTVTPTANGCVGTPSTFTVTVNPTPTVSVVADQGPYCNTNGGSAISFSGPVAGTTFSWSSTVNVGFGLSGNGNIGAFIAINGGTVPAVATVTVTPTANGCVGTPSTFTVTVNPTPTVTSVSNQTQTLSVGQVTSPVTLNGTATSFDWVNNNLNIGLGASGTLLATSGSAVFSSFTVTNSGTATITVTSHYSNAVDCVTAATTNFVITVINPVEPSLLIQMLNSTNVVLEWVAYTNTALLSATNLTPSVYWSTNGVFGAGTNRVTNSILFEPPNQFFRLTNAP